MTAPLSKISIFCVRVGCKIQMVSYVSKHVLQSLLISHLFQLETYRSYMDVQCIEFRVAWEIWLESYGPRHALFILWYNIICIYCKPFQYTTIWCTTTHFNKTYVPYHYTLLIKQWLYCKQCIVLCGKIWLATLHIAVSFHIILYASIKITIRYYHTSLRVCCQVAKQRNINKG